MSPSVSSLISILCMTQPLWIKLDLVWASYRAHDPSTGATATASGREVQVNQWRRVQRQHLAEHQPAHNRNAERPAKSRSRRQCRAPAAFRPTMTPWSSSVMGRNRSRYRQIDGRFRRFIFLPLRRNREIDHHNGVFLHDADQKDVIPISEITFRLVLGGAQRHSVSHAGGRQRRKNRDVGWIRLS